MRFLFELSKDFEDIPLDEIKACFKSENVKYNIIEENKDVFIVESNISKNKIKKISDRLSLTFTISNLLFFCNNKNKDISLHAKKNNFYKKGSIAVTYKKRSNEVDSRKIVKIIADNYSKNRLVDLEKPDIEIRTIITYNKVYVGMKLFEINRPQYEKRKAQNRPFFLPISLNPKIARALVNISGLNDSQIFLDPFCGTGGFLLEAGLMSATIIGSDIEEKMIKGCRKTLDFFNIKNYKLYCLDVGDIYKIKCKVDAIVTDLPYGKSTTTKGENINELYIRAFESISKKLKKGKNAIIGLSTKDMLSELKKFFKIEKVYEIKMHKSLTRYFILVKK